MNTILYVIECCYYYSQWLTTLQSFWWRRSTRSTERTDDHRIAQGCCLCSWQSTIGPQGLSFWPGTVNMILRHGSLVTHVEDKTIGWYCHNAGQHQLSFSICCSLQTMVHCWHFVYCTFDLNWPPPNWGRIHRDSWWAYQLILWLHWLVQWLN